MSSVKILSLAMFGVAALAAAPQAVAQTPLRDSANLIDSERANRKQELDESIATPAELSPVKPATAPKPAAGPALPETGVRFMLNGVEFSATRILSPEELESFGAGYVGREVSFTDINDIVARINAAYDGRNRYIGRAVIPPQEIDDGVLQISLIEAEVEALDVRGAKRMKPGFVEGLLGIEPGELVDVARIQERVLILDRRQNFSVFPSLEAGDQPGGSKLVLNADEPEFFTLSAKYDNFGSRSVGRDRGFLTATLNGLRGVSDTTSLTGFYSDGAHSVSLSHLTPVGNDGVILGGYVSWSETKAVSGSGAEIGTKGRSFLWHLGADIPLFDSLTDTTTLRLDYDGSQTSSDIGAIDREQFIQSFGAKVENSHFHDNGVIFAEAGGSFSYHRESFSNIIDGKTVQDGVNPRMRVGLTSILQPFESFRSATITVSAEAESALRKNPVGGYEYFIGGADSLYAFENSAFGGDSGYLASLEAAVQPFAGKLPEDIALTVSAFAQHGAVFDGMLFDAKDVTRRNFASSIGFGVKLDLTSHLTGKFQAAWTPDDVHRHDGANSPRFLLSVGATF